MAASHAASLRPPIVGRNLDRPSQDSVIEDGLLLVGWVLGAAGPCERVIATGNGQELGHVRADRRRPDIEGAFPDVSHAGHSGFRLHLCAPVLADATEVELFAEFEAGERVKFWTLRLIPEIAAAERATTPAPASATGASTILQQLAQRLRSAASGAPAEPGSGVPPVTSPGEPVASQRSQLRVVALISAFNEADILGAVLEHLGANEIESYLIDDGSTDGTREVAKEWLGRGLIGYERRETQEARTSWRQILRRKQELAEELGADWYIHHDADEIRESPWPYGTLKDAIAWVDRLGYNVIDFRVLQFWPVDDAFSAGDDPCSHFDRWSDPAEYDVAQRKAWKAGYPDTVLDDGGHEVRFAERRLFPIRFPVRHYPIRGQAHGLRKALRERKGRFAEEEVAYGWHRQYDYVQSPDHMFLRNPASLREFNLEEIRLEEMLNANRPDEPDVDVAAVRPAEHPPVRGFLEQVTSSVISGWAGREGESGEPVSVDLWDGARRIATLRADQPRPDLEDKGLAGGGFRLKTPSGLLDGRPHWIWATSSDTGEALRGTPIVLHSGGRLKIGADITSARPPTDAVRNA